MFILVVVKPSLATAPDTELCTFNFDSWAPFSHLAEESIFPRGKVIRGVPLQQQVKDYHLKIPVIKNSEACKVQVQLPGNDGATVTMDPDEPCKNHALVGAEDLCKDEWSLKRGFRGNLYHLRFIEENVPAEVGEYQLMLGSNGTP